MATGSDWQRLAALVSERRGDLRMTQEEVRAAGGPSTATQRLIEGGRQSRYQPRILADLEAALGWQRGSVRRILAGGDPVLAPDALVAAPLSAAPESPREPVAEDADADAMESAVAVALTPRRERQIWAELRRSLAATPAGAALFSKPDQARKWPAGGAPLQLTPEAIDALDAIPADVLFTDPADNAAIRLAVYAWPVRVAMAAIWRARLGRPTNAVRRAG